jgi:hypothetical protein
MLTDARSVIGRRLRCYAAISVAHPHRSAPGALAPKKEFSYVAFDTDPARRG